MSNICVSGADSDKRNGIKRNRNRVGITKPEMAGMLKACPKLICALCQTPIKIWVSGGIECISCDRHIDPDGLYSTENIRFTHQKCNTVEGPWRKYGKSREINDFRNMLTSAGVIWHEPDSIGGMEILSKNEEYFRSNKKQQIKLEIKQTTKQTTKQTMTTTDTTTISVKFNGIQLEGIPVHLALLCSAYNTLTSAPSTKGNVIRAASERDLTATLTGRVRLYIWSLDDNTPLNYKLLQAAFPDDTMPTGMLSDLNKNTNQGVCVKRAKGKGEYLSVKKKVVVEDDASATVVAAVAV
jgi:hypothetical protein